MLEELKDIATKHEEKSPSKSSQNHSPSKKSRRPHSPSSSSLSSGLPIIGVLEVEAKGKKLQLNIRKNVSPEKLVQKFLLKNNLPQKYYEPLIGKVEKMIEEVEKAESDHSSNQSEHESDNESEPENNEEINQLSERENNSSFLNRPPEKPEPSLLSLLNQTSDAESYLDRIIASHDSSKRGSLDEMDSKSFLSSPSTRHLPVSMDESVSSSRDQINIKVKLNSSNTAVLVVSRDSDPSAVAKAFIAKHNLPQASYLPILAKVKSSIDTLERRSRNSDPSPQRSGSAPAMSAAERLRQALKSRKEEKSHLADVVQEVVKSSADSPSHYTLASGSVDSPSIQSASQSPLITSSYRNSLPISGHNDSFSSKSVSSLSPMQSLSGVFQAMSKPNDYSIGSDKTPGGTSVIRVKLSENRHIMLRVSLDEEPNQLAKKFVETHRLPAAALNPLIEKIRKSQQNLRTQSQKLQESESHARKVSPIDRLREALKPRKEINTVADVVQQVASSHDITRPRATSTDSASIHSGKEKKASATSILGSALQRISKSPSPSMHSRESSIDSRSNASRQTNPSVNNSKSHSPPVKSTPQPPPPPLVFDEAVTSVPPPQILSPNSEKELKFNQSLQRFKEMHFTSHQSSNGSVSSGSKEGAFNLQAVAEASEPILTKDTVLSMDVRVNETTVEKLEFRSGESPYGLAAIFVAMHKLPTSYIKPLASEIQAIMNQHLKKLPPTPSTPQPPTKELEDSQRKESLETTVTATESKPNVAEEPSAPLDSSPPRSEGGLHSPGSPSNKFRRSLADSILSPPRLYTRPKREPVSRPQSDERSVASGQSSLPSRRSNASSSAWNSKRDSSSGIYSTSTLPLKTRDTMSIASRSTSNPRRSRSVSPSSQSSSVYDRLYRDAESNALRREEFRYRLQQAEEKELEKKNRRSRSRSFSAKTRSGFSQETESNENPGVALYQRGLQWLTRHQRDIDHVRTALDNQAKESEEQECSFHPTLFTNLRRSKSTSQLYGSGDSSQSSKNIFDALYEYGLEQNERKKILIHQHLVQEESSSFRPIISARSNKLAEKKRKKRIHGASVQGHQPRGDVQSQAKSIDGEGDDGYHSAQEGGDELYSRRSSLETASSPVLVPDSSVPPSMEPLIPLANEDQEDVKEKELSQNHPNPPPPLPSQTSPEQPQTSSRSLKFESSPKKLSVFDMLYEERKELEKSKEASIAKYSMKPTFRPDIGMAHHRIVEDNVDEFTQRLYSHHLNQKQHREELEAIERIRLGENHHLRTKKLPLEGIEKLNKRMQDTAEYYRERHQERIKNHDQEVANKRNSRCENEKSNQIVQKNRRVAYEEIFQTLLMTVEYAKSQQQQQSTSNDVKNPENWHIMKSEGEEVYEMCPPAHQEEVSAPPHPVEQITTESSPLTEPEDTMNVSKNLTLIFNQPEIMEGTKDSLSSTSQASHELKKQSSFYYFRGETLAKAEEKSHATHSSHSSKPQKGTQTQSLGQDQHGPHQQENKKPLLDTSRAMPNLLKPPALCQAVTMVLEATAPAMITFNEFVECFEVLLESGLAPPLNMILGVPQKSSEEPRLSSVEKELKEECRPVPQLYPGKKGTKLREKVKLETNGKTRHEHLYNCDAVLAKKKEEYKQQILYENSKELTFQPTLYTRNRQQRQRPSSAPRRR